MSESQVNATEFLCADFRVPAEKTDKAFMRVCNFLVSLGLRYMSCFQELARDGKAELVRCQARVMIRLLDRDRIQEFDYGLINHVLDYIEVTAYGKLAVISLMGTRGTA